MEMKNISEDFPKGVPLEGSLTPCWASSGLHSKISYLGGIKKLCKACPGSITSKQAYPPLG